MQTRSKSQSTTLLRVYNDRRIIMTRSQHLSLKEYETHQEHNIENHIDFDDASRSWQKNKQYIGNGCYKYI